MSSRSAQELHLSVMICRVELLLSARNFVLHGPTCLSYSHQKAVVLLEGMEGGCVATVGQINPPLLRFGTREGKKKLIQIPAY